jgi:hypothetical protein
VRRVTWSFIFPALILAAAPCAPVHAQLDGEYRMTFTFSAFIAFGAVWPSFEYRMDNRNSFLLEGAYYAFGSSKGSYEVGGGYRRYISAKGNRGEGGFLGGFTRVGKNYGETTERGVDYKYHTNFLQIGPNAGWKWQWDNGACFTTRFGYGYPFTDMKWEPKRPEPDWVAPFTAALMGLDAEISAGYSF